jgi:hypothetical protein
MKEHGAPSTTFDQLSTAKSTAPKRSDRIRSEVAAGLSKAPAATNANDQNIEKDKPTLSAFSKHEKGIEHHIDCKDFRVVSRAENPYRLLVKELLLIQACKTEINRSMLPMPLIVFSNGLTTDMLPDLNG